MENITLLNITLVMAGILLTTYSGAYIITTIINSIINKRSKTLAPLILMLVLGIVLIYLGNILH